MRNSDRMSRLSGECPRVASYVKSRGAPGFLNQAGGPRHAGGSGGWLGSPGPGRGTSPGFFDPFTPPPTGPQPDYPAPKPPKGLPYRPPARPGKPTSPLVKPPSGPKGGMSLKGLGRLGRLTPWTLGFSLILDYLDRPTGNFNPYDMLRGGYKLLKECPPLGGWAYVPGIPYSGPDTAVKWVAADPNLSCGIGSQTGYVRLSPTPPTIPGTNVGWVAFGPENQSVAVGRMQIRQQWIKVGSGHPSMPPIPNTVPGDGFEPMPAPYPWPQIDPFILPPFAPEPYPAPIPHKEVPEREPNPNSDPKEQPGGSQPSTPPRAIPPRTGTGIPAVEVEVSPAPPGPTKPAPGVPGEEGPLVRTQPRRVRHQRARPSPRVRERKKLMDSRTWHFISEALGIVTESRDLLQAFFDSLSKEARDAFNWKDSTAIDLFAHVVENLDQISLGDLIANITAMLLEDAGVGKLGKQAAQMNKSLHDHFGIDLRGRMPKAYLNETPPGAKAPELFPGYGF